MTPAILKADTGLRWISEHRFAALHVGLGRGLRKRLSAANLRDWRADLCAPDIGLIVEIEGGGWKGGRHSRPVGFADDLIKYDDANRLGYYVYRCDYAMIRSGRAFDTIKILCRRLAPGGGQ